MMSRTDLTRLPIIKSAVKNRWPQLAVFIVMLMGYLFAILAGLVGTPVGSHNFSIVFVWTAWWAILILAAVPFFGRGWCGLNHWRMRGTIEAKGRRVPGKCIVQYVCLVHAWLGTKENWLFCSSFFLQIAA